MNSEDLPVDEKVTTTEVTASATAIKRPFLEVSELDKFKSVLINKTFETKRFKASDALDRVKQFLPSLKESTDKLLAECKENPESVDIENCDDDEKVIEMNLQFVKEEDDEDESDDDDSDSGEGTSETDDEENENKNDEQKVLDINELINKGQEEREIKINSDIVFNKSKSKTQKKPFIKIIKNNNEEEEDTTEDSTSQIEDNQPCTSESTQ